MLRRKFRWNFFIAIAFAVVSTIAIFLIPLVDSAKSSPTKWQLYAVGGAFWLGVILQQIFLFKTNADRKMIERQMKREKVVTIKNQPIGFLVFFQNKEAAVSDTVFIVTATSAVFMFILQVKMEWLIITCVALMFLSFNLHCFLNGKNYRYIKTYSKFEKERGKNDSSKK